MKIESSSSVYPKERETMYTRIAAKASQSRGLLTIKSPGIALAAEAGEGFFIVVF